MIFSVSNGTVLARTRLDDGQAEINTSLAGIQLGVLHDWKIIWKADNSIEFWVDDVLKATHTRVFAEQLRVYVSAGQTVNADWVQVNGTSPTPTPTPPPTTILRDDFDGNTLDSSKWIAGNWLGGPINVSVGNGFATMSNY